MVWAQRMVIDGDVREKSVQLSVSNRAVQDVNVDNVNRDDVSVHRAGLDHHVTYRHVQDVLTVIVSRLTATNLSVFVSLVGLVINVVSHVQPRHGDETVKTSVSAGTGILAIQKLENARFLLST